MIWIDGEPVVPSFRTERGTSPAIWSDDDGGFVRLMHPYDVALKLAEAGEIKQAFAALSGFMERYLDILELNANMKLTNMVLAANIES